MQSHIHSVETSAGLFLEQVWLRQRHHLTEGAEPSGVWMARSEATGGKKFGFLHILSGVIEMLENRGACQRYSS